MKRPLIAALLVALLAGRVNGQAKLPVATPDRILFGTVYTGATVQASLSVRASPNSDERVKFEITAPNFVKVLRKNTYTRPAKVGAGLLRGSVEFALDTTRASELAGQIAVRLNSTSVEIPVSASVKPQRSGLLQLLVIGTPFVELSTSDGGMFRQWTDLVAGAPWNVHYLLAERGQPVPRDLDLDAFGAVLVGPEGVARLEGGDVKRVRKYVEHGGTALVMANNFFRPTVAKANILLAGYGLAMVDVESGRDVTLEKTQIDPQLVKFGIGKVTFFRPSPITVVDPLRAKVLIKDVNAEKPGDGLVAAATVGNGKIIVIGQSLWWSWISSQHDTYGGNAMLLKWALTSAHERKQRLLALKQPLSAAQLASCWTKLGSEDIDEASEAGYWLARAPEAGRQSGPFLKDHLHPDRPPDVNRVNALIARLDGESFQARDKAQRELAGMGEFALYALRKTLEGKPSPEVQRRVAKILSEPQPMTREKRQYLRAIGVLEQVATPEAKELLQALSKGCPGTRVTAAAQAALDRLALASRSGPQ
jgi:hypothetical protein